MIKVKVTVGTNSSEAEVWRAKYNGDGTASLYTGLDESKRIIVNKGNIITLDPLDVEDSIICMKMYGNGDLKNICEEIQTRMVCKLMETDTSHLVTFAQISEICQPAFGIQAMSLDAPNEYIYSTGSNSLSDRMCHNPAVRTGLIRNAQIGRRKVLLMGGYENIPVKLMTERALHEFATVVNNYFPE